jgi:DNA-binding transcriptional MerR regulator
VNWQSESTDVPVVETISSETAARGPAEPALPIGEISARTGLSARTIRYYEEVGLLPGVRRRAGGRRVYGADEVERLRFIQRLKTLGLSLSEIEQLSALYALGGSTQAMLVHLKGLLDAHTGDLERRIGELVGLRDEMTRYREHITERIGQLSGREKNEGE